MIFECRDLERALRSPELMPDARAHAERCERCSRELYLWSEISRVAPELHREWDSPELWTRIQAEMEAAPVTRGPERSWFRHWRWAVAAAAVAVVAVVLLRPWAARRPGGQDFLTEDALREVESSEAVYARSIEKLSAVAEPSLERSPSPLAAAYREKLLLLDSAIADLKASMANNRFNVYLQTQLASLYREKQQTLEDWLKNAQIN